ncbi:serine/threonine protein kinase [Arthrobacter gandavensis]|uniref:serine/threonine-protein kinase n=1 Tax=Arthrobacter gandavensis TaxID=169960 RepID=UPI00188E84E0|nr:serine/threonine-protein kinase [Arthrobacter gandavensis]MBF4993527.1 serine/threonine protein kinase [Arthrobacter gandavensis]
MDLFLGQRYRTTDLIGTGGAASVHRAMDENLGREVAVKVFRSSVQEDDDYRRQHTETLLLATLNHPGLVTLLDAGQHHEDDSQVLNYLVMELVDGPDLRRTLKSGPLPAVSVASLGADLADALAYVHSKGVIHRDVKPANILLYPQEHDSRLYPKLTDFGIARLVEATVATAHGATIGTANYLSPEQAQGGTVAPSTDIYSLGLVLLESLTGEKAFPGPIVEAAVARLLRDPEIPDSLGPEWVELLRAMTNRLPDARPAAHEAASALRALAVEPETAVPHSDVDEPDAEEVCTGGVTTGNIYIPLPPSHAPSLG